MEDLVSGKNWEKKTKYRRMENDNLGIQTSFIFENAVF